MLGASAAIYFQRATTSRLCSRHFDMDAASLCSVTTRLDQCHAASCNWAYGTKHVSCLSAMPDGASSSSWLHGVDHISWLWLCLICPIASVLYR